MEKEKFDIEEEKKEWPKEAFDDGKSFGLYIILIIAAVLGVSAYFVLRKE